MRAAYVAAGLLLAAALSSGSAQDTTSATIEGRVVSSYGEPIAGATVNVLSVTSVRADSTGAFRILSLPPGALLVRATMIGFQPLLKMLILDTGMVLRVDFSLQLMVQKLPVVEVREDSTTSLLRDPSGFDERRHNGMGYFITAQDIEKKHVMTTLDLFHGIPAVQVDRQGVVVIKRGEISLQDFTTKPSCFGAQVFVDGVDMGQGFDINLIPVQEIRGIELYQGPANTPSALRSIKTMCGTIAIWTKV